MDTQQRLTCRQARDFDLVDYLASLGHAPTRVRGHDHWYCSPLRVEHVPSFKVNRRLNRWYDHGLGEGGNLVDFGLRYHGCTVSDLLRQLAQGTALPREAVPCLPRAPREKPASRLRILRQVPLSRPTQCAYLRARGISPATAAPFCTEVTYTLYGREYTALGFANDEGGYELRSPAFKGGSSPKGITTIGQGAGEALVFEGFFDFLSYVELHPRWSEKQAAAVVLNSVAFFEKARPFLERHNTVRLYLDNDATGRRCTRQALEASLKYRDESHLYRSCKDINDYLVQHGRKLRKARRLRLS